MTTKAQYRASYEAAIETIRDFQTSYKSAVDTVSRLSEIIRRQHEIIATRYCADYDTARCEEECPLHYDKNDCEVTRIMDGCERLGVELI